MTLNNGETASPKWSPTIKLVISLIIVTLIAAFLVNFRNIIGPLLLAFIITYLLHPLTGLFSRITHLSWRASANILFLIFIVKRFYAVMLFSFFLTIFWSLVS